MKLILLTNGQPAARITTWAVLTEDVRADWHKYNQSHLNSASLIADLRVMLEQHHWHAIMFKGAYTAVIDFKYIEGFIFDEYAKENDR